ncbi:isopropylmalate isomerase [Erythrobacteraceae bacterium CFH 75059]|uniref:isopropylmalate isomerase n=1 Tax=Qipengyuania thermophila TaxID=2509361 RepID=UPI00101F25C8|nr:isopropylmalate isomerase [Qipengyuania thermophila]TCD01873.1 isopropylmalate isomerase [Erythrobacteraceae bacterium CFH 75059]
MTSKPARNVARTAALAVGAIGSAAIAAAYLYSSRRREGAEHKGTAPARPPSGEPPQTD